MVASVLSVYAESLAEVCDVLSLVDEEAVLLSSAPQPPNNIAENENTAIPTINFFAFIIIHLLLVYFPHKKVCDTPNIVK